MPPLCSLCLCGECLSLQQRLNVDEEAEVAVRHHARTEPGQRVEPEALITFHPRHGIRMTVAYRA